MTLSDGCCCSVDTHVVVQLAETDDTPWVGGAGTDRLYLQSGRFTSTVKDSYATGRSATSDISWDGANTPWCATGSGQGFYLQSGQFTSTIKDSLKVTGNENGVSWDGANTPTNVSNKLVLYSGQFTSTVKDSQAVTGIANPKGVSYDGADTPVAELGGGIQKLHLISGQFTNTIKTSTAMASAVYGISEVGGDTPFSGFSSGKLYVASGQFTTTIKTSEDVSSINSVPLGLETNSVTDRIT